MILNLNVISIRSTGDNYFHSYGKQVNFLSGSLLSPPGVECNRKQLNMCGCSYYYILVTERD
ncbi:hypothetical protein DPA88_21710 [Salmonella enterica subsp. salamae]|uniref:Uncharacterized protein n=3 Tax=Salmonella enterica TaxID=28901 RepID=A0A3W7Z7C4_SALER|nr:hypothetical protein [Salmonella enterica subsp. salamae]EAB2011897.1 hypothetical protein [Salmonella enterica]ECT8650222.1 hypothetical protein [Salmonella enterica subsp. salamae serovar 50:b:z6]EAA6248457.1 hypothetical protein [Salmonella enterica subsp. salamae]EAB9863999.1 hypothetical protein [Salmonella enterica subsp. salamae]